MKRRALKAAVDRARRRIRAGAPLEFAVLGAAWYFGVEAEDVAERLWPSRVRRARR